MKRLVTPVVIATLSIAPVVIPSTPSAWAQVAQVQAELGQCEAGRCPKTLAYGSAVYVGKTSDGRHWFLSAGHLFARVLGPDDGGETEAGPTFLLVDDRPVPVRVVRTRQQGEVDLALLTPDEVRTGPCLPLAPATPLTGEGAVLAGYPEGGAFRAVRGRIVNTPFLGHPVAFDRRCHEGDSGGAVVVGGRVVGVVSGYPLTDREYCLFTSAAAARQFLFESLGELPRCPADSPQPTE